MAKKTDQEVGKQIRDAIGSITLSENEVISTVNVILIAQVKNTQTGAVVPKGSTGLDITDYSGTSEDIKKKW